MGSVGGPSAPSRHPAPRCRTNEDEFEGVLVSARLRCVFWRREEAEAEHSKQAAVKEQSSGACVLALPLGGAARAAALLHSYCWWNRFGRRVR